MFVDSFIHSFIHMFVDSFIRSFIGHLCCQLNVFHTVLTSNIKSLKPCFPISVFAAIVPTYVLPETLPYTSSLKLGVKIKHSFMIVYLPSNKGRTRDSRDCPASPTALRTAGRGTRGRWYHWRTRSRDSGSQVTTSVRREWTGFLLSTNDNQSVIVTVSLVTELVICDGFSLGSSIINIIIWK